MLEFCEKENIQHEICGKLIVATNKSEESKLQDIYDRGIENGLSGIKILSETELKNIEPHVSGTKAIHVPQAGIVSYKQVAEKLKEILFASGVDFFFENKSSLKMRELRLKSM